jgi:putative flippase GtrA
MRISGNPEAARFVKFCVIGFSNVALSLIIFNVLYALTRKLIFSSTLSYFLCVANGFYWNRRWAFKDSGAQPGWKQPAKFFISYLIAYCINISLNTYFVSLLAAYQSGVYDSGLFWQVLQEIAQGRARPFSFLLVNTAGLASAAVAIILNYAMNRFWTFRKTVSKTSS